MSASPSLLLQSTGLRTISHRTALIRHTSRGIVQPNVDRYSAIRLFFMRQLVIPSSSPSEPHRRNFLTPPRLRGQSIRCTNLLRYYAQFPRFNHSEAKETGASARHATPQESPDQKQEPKHVSAGASAHLPPLNLDNYPRLYRRLAQSLSHLHRPTKDDFLNVASGFWQRLRIRFKWFTIRSFRRFNADDISAFITWFLMSQTLWILVGT
jgi:distribution and morphology protein 31